MKFLDYWRKVQMMELIKKIHADSDDTCYAGILKAWDQTFCSDEEESRLYDKLFPVNEFYKQCEIEIDNYSEDSYFTINSFWNTKKQSMDVRHLNCFVLDFDFYNITKYKELKPIDFYNNVLKKKLSFEPTAVVDSGRGIYVLYAFKHCSYHLSKLYKSITKAFFKKYQRYGLDPKAMNITQVIRIPGTLNTRAFKEVEILEFNDTNYSIQDFTSLLPHTADEVKKYRKDRIKGKSKISNSKQKKNDRFQVFLEDLKKLIQMRNHAKYYEGYREYLIYIMQEWAFWSGYTSDEAIDTALKVNQLFHEPLSEHEVRNRCKPSPGRMKSSIETIISKLEISHDECKHLKILCPRWMKKQSYARRKRKHKLLNMTEKQSELLERRTSVCELKYDKHMKNSQIAYLLGIDKSTVTRDLQYIQSHPQQFSKSLETFLNEMECARHTEDFMRKTLYDTQMQLLEWMKRGYTALQYLIQELGVAKN